MNSLSTTHAHTHTHTHTHTHIQFVQEELLPKETAQGVYYKNSGPSRGQLVELFCRVDFYGFPVLAGG
jgi:hypothetical protein